MGFSAPEPHSTRSLRVVHHDAAIHVTPTPGAPAPSPAGFGRTQSSGNSRTSALFDPQFRARVTMQPST